MENVSFISWQHQFQRLSQTSFWLLCYFIGLSFHSRWQEVMAESVKGVNFIHTWLLYRQRWKGNSTFVCHGLAWALRGKIIAYKGSKFCCSLLLPFKAFWVEEKISSPYHSWEKLLYHRFFSWRDLKEILAKWKYCAQRESLISNTNSNYPWRFFNVTTVEIAFSPGLTPFGPLLW